MEIIVYLHDSEHMESTLKVLDILKRCDLPFTFKTFKSESLDEVSDVIGEKVRRLPQVVIDGDRVGGYYDLLEFLVNKKITNYAGELHDGESA